MIDVENLIRDAAASVLYINEVDKGRIHQINAEVERDFPLLYMMPFEDTPAITANFLVSRRIKAPFYILINHGADIDLDVDNNYVSTLVNQAYGYAIDIIDYISNQELFEIRSMKITEVRKAPFTNYICSGVYCEFIISPQDMANC